MKQPTDLKKLFIRPAIAADAAALASLIHLSAPGIYHHMLGHDERLALDILTRISAQPGVLISYENVIAAELEGRIIGAALLYNRRTEIREGIRFFRQVCKNLPLHHFPLILCRLLAMRLMVMAPGKQSFYLSVLSVAPELQGHGIGALLLDAGKQKAKQLHLTHLEADVETENEEALRFYKRYGFIVVGEKHTGRLRSLLGFEGYYRIRCAID